MPIVLGTENVSQVFEGLGAGVGARTREYGSVYLGDGGPTGTLVFAGPPAAAITSFAVSPDHFNQGESGAPSAISFQAAFSRLPSSLSLATTRPDGTSISTVFHPSAIALAMHFTQARPTILGRTDYALHAGWSDGASGSLHATFEARLAAAITSFTDGGFRTDPQPGGGLIYKHRMDWRLNTAVYPGLSDPRYSAVLSKVSGPGSFQADALRATNRSDGRGTLNLTVSGSRPPRGTSTTMRLTATNPAGSAHADLALLW